MRTSGGTLFSYQKAVDVRNPDKFVYAGLHDSEDWLGPFPGGLHFKGRLWIVWHPESVEFQDMAPEDFDERYVLEDNAPAAMRERFALIPTYDEWLFSLEDGEEILQ